MSDPTIVGSIDIAELVFLAFVLFFIGLIFYLRREDRREGCLPAPLECVAFPHHLPRNLLLSLSDGGSDWRSISHSGFGI